MNYIKVLHIPVLVRKYDINPKTISTWQQKIRHPENILATNKSMVNEEKKI